MPALAEIQLNGVSGSRVDIARGAVVTLSNADDTGVTVWAWEMLSRPNGSAAALSDPSAAAPTFTADVEGSYLVQLLVNGGEAISREIVGVRTARVGLRIPATSEAGERGTRGWSEDLEVDWRDRIDRLLASGAVQVCISGEAGAVAVGSVVRVSAQQTANAQSFPTVLLADEAGTGADEALGIVLGRVAASGSVPASGVCLVQFAGHAPVVVVSAPVAAGGALYLTATPGTLAGAGTRRAGVSVGSGGAMILPSGGGAAPSAPLPYTFTLAMFGPFNSVATPFELDAGWYAFNGGNLTDAVLLKSVAGSSGSTTVEIKVNGVLAHTVTIAFGALVQRTAPGAPIALVAGDRVTATVTTVETGSPYDLVLQLRVEE